MHATNDNEVVLTNRYVRVAGKRSGGPISRR